MTHSPHAAAASRRFLTPPTAGAGAGFYGAATATCSPYADRNSSCARARAG